MSIDVDAVRRHFPALEDGGAYFDGPGGTQTPDAVASAVRKTLLGPLSNRGQLSPGERLASDVVAGARDAMADLLGADPRGIVFGRSMTQLTFDFSRTIARDWGPDDEVVVSRLDHDANVRPWLIAARDHGSTVRWIDFDPETGEVDAGDVRAALTARTRLVALTGASNLIGTRPDLAGISALVHDAGALLYVDGVHLTAHSFVDVAELGADLYACSPYKFLGPHCGVLAAKPELLESLWPDKLRPATDDVPERFELGTLPYELMAGTTAAVEFLAGLAPGEAVNRREQLRLSLAALEEHEHALRTRLDEGIAELPGVRLRSRARRRTPTILITFQHKDPAEVSQSLARREVFAPSGTFYAYEPAKRLGLDVSSGGVRAGIAPYTSDEDVTRLLDGLREQL
jgi:cysteine desulfurase family protein (TIGR01976 family)